MTLFNYTKPCMIVADRGKQIREKKDIYKEAVINKDGNIIEPEHVPYYTTIIFVPDSFTEKEMNELYIEEIIK